MAAFLGELESGTQLRPTTTRVTKRDGSVHLEAKDGTLTRIGDGVLLDLAQRDAYGWDESAGQWTRHTPDVVVEDAQEQGTLRVVTYNVWFAEENQEERAHALLGELAELDPPPDVVFLQEVTAPFWAVFLASAWTRKTLVVSDSPVGNSLVPYGVVAAVNVASMGGMVDLSVHPLPSNMGRKVVTAHTCVGGVALATAHLESLANAELRAAQAAEIRALLDPAIEAGNPVVFAGDTNVPGGSSESLALASTLAPLRDSFDGLGPASAFHTTMHGKPGMRIDRVFVSDSVAFAGLVTLGDGADASGMTASDHLGLVFDGTWASGALQPSE